VTQSPIERSPVGATLRLLPTPMAAARPHTNGNGNGNGEHATAKVVTGLTSVIVPTHNDGANIGHLLERLLAEPRVGEILVIASECRDETIPTVIEIGEAADNRLHLFTEATRSGKAAAVNFGLQRAQYNTIVIVSGDVLPEPGAIDVLVDALDVPGVGLAGGRPVPVNPGTTIAGHAVHLLWRLHHRLALHQPKLGEIIALRADAAELLPQTSVDEACFQARLEAVGWRSVYRPDAIVANRGPSTIRDFVRQRRQIHTGHLWLRRREGYTVPSLRLGILTWEFCREVFGGPGRGRSRRVALGAAAAGLEIWSRARAHIDVARGREKHVWEMVTSAKDPALGPNGVGAGRSELVEGEGLA
jgi:poly-beta-1,6-N-acetyl-D-glucosamine synthase